MKPRAPHRRSSLTILAPEIREAVDRAIREDRATIMEITATINAMGGEASKSAVGRYVKNAREELKDTLRFQNMAKTWITEIGKNPEGDTARLMFEFVKTFGLNTMPHLKHEESSPMDLMLLGKFIDHISRADKGFVERDKKVDDLVAARMAKAATALDRAVKKGGLTATTADKIRREILGIAP